MAIDAIRQSGAVAVEIGDRRRRNPRRRPVPWRGIAQVVGRDGVEVTDALAITALGVDRPETDADDTDSAISATSVARRLRGAAAAALAAQARLSAAAVIRLVDPRG